MSKLVCLAADTSDGDDQLTLVSVSNQEKSCKLLMEISSAHQVHVEKLKLLQKNSRKQKLEITCLQTTQWSK